MAKIKTIFYCTECGAETSRWMGRCNSCGAWNTIVEKKVEKLRSAGLPLGATEDRGPQRISEIDLTEVARMGIGNEEWDRTLGGGLVPGSLVLIGGDPGVGKSTLLLQVTSQIAESGKTVLYVSGEESASQIRLRAERLQARSDSYLVYATTDLLQALEQAGEVHASLLVIDSIQTMQVASVDALPGSTSQVKECTARLLRYAKDTQTSIIIIGHVTKEGNIAGPKMLEHMVDTVLYLEGEAGQSLRILRPVKNRFGDTSESGVFVMEEDGLKAVHDLSELLLEERSKDRVGTIVFAGMEGVRPLLAEVQALTNRTFYGTARRTAIGYDYNRLTLLLAVLEKKAGLSLSEYDVYVNVAGGLRIAETGMDLPVALAVASVFSEKALPAQWAAVGEVGLTGDIRRVTQVEKRLRELAKMGFTDVLIPRQNLERLSGNDFSLRLHPVAHIKEAIALLSRH